MTLNDVMAVTSPYFTELGRFRAHYVKWLKIHVHFLRPKCGPKNLVFSDITLTAIFAEVTENEYIIARHLRDRCQKALI